MQRPDAKHVVNLPLAGFRFEKEYKNRPRNGTDHQRAHRMIKIRPGANGHQPRQRAVVHEARVVFRNQHRGNRPANHRHQRVDRHQTGNRFNRTGAHHIKTEPADNQHPAAQRKKRNAADLDGIGLVALQTCAEQHNRRQRQPAADGVHHHGAGIVVKRRTEGVRQPPACARQCVRKTSPERAFDQRINQPDKNTARQRVGPELRTLGDSAGNDGGNAGCKAEQQEKLHIGKTVIHRQRFNRNQKRNTASNRIAD